MSQRGRWDPGRRVSLSDAGERSGRTHRDCPPDAEPRDVVSAWGSRGDAGHGTRVETFAAEAQDPETFQSRFPERSEPWAEIGTVTPVKGKGSFSRCTVAECDSLSQVLWCQREHACWQISAEAWFRKRTVCGSRGPREGGGAAAGTARLGTVPPITQRLLLGTRRGRGRRGGGWGFVVRAWAPGVGWCRGRPSPVRACGLDGGDLLVFSDRGRGGLRRHSTCGLARVYTSDVQVGSVLCSGPHWADSRCQGAGLFGVGFGGDSAPRLPTPSGESSSWVLED